MQRSACSFVMPIARDRRRMTSPMTSDGEAVWGTFTVYFMRLLSSDTTHTHTITELSETKTDYLVILNFQLPLGINKVALH